LHPLDGLYLKPSHVHKHITSIIRPAHNAPNY
jgi:hypothetical protein